MIFIDENRELISTWPPLDPEASQSWTPVDVGSLCSIGESSKAHRKGYIGEKGIADSDYGPPDGCRFRSGPIVRSLNDRAAMPVN